MIAARKGQLKALHKAPDHSYRSCDRLSGANLSRRFQPNNWTSSLGAPTTSTVTFYKVIVGLVSHQIPMSRAVDNQVYFSMCSPARDLTAGYHAVCLSRV